MAEGPLGRPDMSGYEEGEGSEREHVERTVLIIADVGLRSQETCTEGPLGYP